jgi:ATP/maltotriose-dependent transcriptional regulator MalT
VAQITEDDQLLRCPVGWNMAVAMPLQRRVTELRLAGDEPAYADEREQLVLATRGDEVGALDALTQALALARPVGYARILVDEGAPIVDLLGKLIMARRTHPARAAGVPPGYLRQLVDAISRESVRQGAAVVQGLVDPLSARELEILELLAAGKANARLPTSWWWRSTRSRST